VGDPSVTTLRYLPNLHILIGVESRVLLNSIKLPPCFNQIDYLQSSPTGPAEHCAGGSLPKSWSSWKPLVKLTFILIFIIWKVSNK